ncbi:MAG: NAD(P)/FAD-dependent oxidoreductase, partial [Chloroflexota bacterium]
HLLMQRGVDFEILEASSVYGGRMKRTDTFANFPIPLGAEWLHVDRGVLNEIVNDGSIDVGIETTPYDPKVDFGLYEGERISIEEIFTIDQKFINATWFDFYEQYIVPGVEAQIQYNKVVDLIDYSEETVRVTTQDGETLTTDYVICTVPVKMLQNRAVEFVPPLPDRKQRALEEVTVWDGCKAFIEFSEKFYPSVVAFDIVPETDGQKLYYDAAYGQDSDQHILGLFAVGTGATPYIEASAETLIEIILQELDELFDGRASASYIKHIFQNWNAEPFINGAYVTDHESWTRVRTLGDSVDGRLFFAGTSYTDGEDWSSVHTAGRSAIRAVEDILG